MATREKSTKIKQKDINITFEKSTLNSTAIETMLFRKPEAEEDDPMIFICGTCRLTVGDSLSWDGSEDSPKQIRLKKVTENVLLGAESHLHEEGKRCSCLVVDLFCRGCHNVLGMVYKSTPRELDHKRFTFCFDVAKIDSYVLGSAKKMLPADGPEEQPASLEYLGVVEQQLSEMKMLVLTMAKRIEEVDTGLQGGPVEGWE